jgi:hypothetical protein
MTEKQIIRVKTKIANYKKALASDKRMWGGYYHDGRGIRYIIPEQYILIKDFKGGLAYMNWFQKNFPDDSCYPYFFLQWAIILFHCKNTDLFQQKICNALFDDTKLFQKWIDAPPLQNGETHNYDALMERFEPLKADEFYLPFVFWVKKFIQSNTFIEKVNEVVALEQALITSKQGESLREILNKLFKLKYC